MKEDFEKAIPYPFEVSRDDLKKAISSILPIYEDKPTDDQVGAIPGTYPEQQAVPAPGATTGGYNYPGPYTRHEVLCPYTIYPYEGFDLVSNSSALNSCVNIFNIYSRFGTNTTSI